MDVTDRKIRLAVYRTFRDTGRRPSLVELADDAGVSMDDVRTALRRLERSHVVALVPGGDDIWMAHPFSGVDRSYQVTVNDITYTANCAWDALAIPAILKADVVVDLPCAGTGGLEPIRVHPGGVDGGEGVVHHMVPPRDFWNDIGFT